MPACNCYGDPADRELHAVGCCVCALYVGAPPQKQLTLEEAEHLLGRFGFHLEQQPDGRYVAVDPARGLQTPNGSSRNTAHDPTELAGLVVRARCTDQLAGPMLISEATATLAALGFELKTRDHRTFGRQWWATSQVLAVSTSEWGYLKDVVATARSWLAQSRYHAVRQPDLPAILAQLPRDLDPKLRERSPRRSPPAESGGESPPASCAAPATLPDGPRQISLGLEAPQKSGAVKSWPTRREARRKRRS
ncbi:MAG: hypothetical protein HGA45_21505 [Chloroflexales bacterium]|nr:hypothetical protein [Chloroflexales bacterium]